MKVPRRGDTALFAWSRGGRVALFARSDANGHFLCATRLAGSLRVRHVWSSGTQTAEEPGDFYIGGALPWALPAALAPAAPADAARVRALSEGTIAASLTRHGDIALDFADSHVLLTAAGGAVHLAGPHHSAARALFAERHAHALSRDVTRSATCDACGRANLAASFACAACDVDFCEDCHAVAYDA